jgi:glycosyltransferase involved in cell wall biosynthesis
MIQIKEAFQRHFACVIIPTYNNDKTLEEVLNSVLEYTDTVIVVNDGSTDSTSAILHKFPGIEVCAYPVNKGKGYALQTGFKRAGERGFKYAITIDSDGQHFADDLPVFIGKLEDTPDAIIIGARNMDQTSVPGKSSFGNRFSNFWFWFETGLKISDTQSGYRLYPLKEIERIRFFTRKFEFEIEVLVRSAWRGIEIKEVPVQVFYAERSKRVSHFRPFRDFSRISILNTALVTIALTYIKPRDFIQKLFKGDFRTQLKTMLFGSRDSDGLKALSVAFGVFMGIVPLWGFQLMLAIALAFLLRLNKALVIIAANISIPPMIPVILFLSHVTGSALMGDRAVYISFDKHFDFEMLQDSFLQYVLGAFALAITAGCIFGVITYSLLKIFRR